MIGLEVQYSTCGLTCGLCDQRVGWLRRRRCPPRPLLSGTDLAQGSRKATYGRRGVGRVAQRDVMTAEEELMARQDDRGARHRRCGALVLRSTLPRFPDQRPLVLGERGEHADDHAADQRPAP